MAVVAATPPRNLTKSKRLLHTSSPTLRPASRLQPIKSSVFRKLVWLTVIALVAAYFRNILFSLKVTPPLHFVDLPRHVVLPSLQRDNASCPLTAVQALEQPLRRTFRIHTFADTLIVSPSTVVTCYFRLNSKHTSSNYNAWIPNMLSTLDAMVVFTEPALVDTIRSLRQHALNATVVVSMRLEDLPIAQLCAAQYPSPSLFWQHQLDIDPERLVHKSYRLFWIWLSKTWFVIQATRHNFFQSDFFMYSDIGCYRNRKYYGKRIVQHPELVPEGTILWMAHHPIVPSPSLLWNQKLNPAQQQYFYHSGSQGAGSLQAWRGYHTVFAETVDAFIEHNNMMFVGEDQVVLQSACRRAPHLCAYAPMNQVYDHRYFGLRRVLHYGGSSHYQFWRPPQVVSNMTRRPTE
jgi:hypothetical protein